MEDQQIVALFWLRSEEALEQARAKYGRLLQQLCGNILDDPQAAEECVNDTLLALWNTIPPQRPAPLAQGSQADTGGACGSLRREAGQRDTLGGSAHAGRADRGTADAAMPGNGSDTGVPLRPADKGGQRR